MSTLNRKTPIPLYYQLIEMIRKDIETGVLKPGDIIPSERELSERYQISRPTVRQAIKELAYEGLLNREKGRGTFVSRPKFNYGFIQQFSTFYDDMAEKGYQVHTKVLNIEVRNDLPNIGKILKMCIRDRSNVYPFLMGMAALKHEKIDSFPEIQNPDDHLLVAHCGYFGLIPRSFSNQWKLKPRVLEIVHEDATAIQTVSHLSLFSRNLL